MKNPSAPESGAASCPIVHDAMVCLHARIIIIIIIIMFIATNCLDGLYKHSDLHVTVFRAKIFVVVTHNLGAADTRTCMFVVCVKFLVCTK